MLTTHATTPAVHNATAITIRATASCTLGHVRVTTGIRDAATKRGPVWGTARDVCTGSRLTECVSSYIGDTAKRVCSCSCSTVKRVRAAT